MRLHPLHRIEYGYGSVQHAQGALDFYGEVDMPGRVDNVNAMLAPFAGRGGRGDCDAALPFLIPVIHDGRAVVPSPIYGPTGVIQYPLGRRRLPASIWAMIRYF